MNSRDLQFEDGPTLLPCRPSPAMPVSRQVRTTPQRTKIIIRATRTQKVLGEQGHCIRELTSVVQKRFDFATWCEVSLANEDRSGRRISRHYTLYPHDRTSSDPPCKSSKGWGLLGSPTRDRLYARGRHVGIGFHQSRHWCEKCSAGLFVAFHHPRSTPFEASRSLIGKNHWHDRRSSGSKQNSKQDLA